MTAPRIYRGKNGFTSARMKNSMVDKLQALNESAQAALRPAAHAGAIVFNNEMLARVPVDDGDLKASLYRFFVDRKSSDTRKVYVVGPNKKEAPHWHLQEFGHWRVNVVVRDAKGKLIATTERLDDPVFVPANPYIRPTFDAKAGEVVNAMKVRYAEKLRESGTGWQ